MVKEREVFKLPQPALLFCQLHRIARSSLRSGIQTGRFPGSPVKQFLLCSLIDRDRCDPVSVFCSQGQGSCKNTDPRCHPWDSYSPVKYRED